MNYVSKLIQIALNEVGYTEKASNKNLDDKTANAGSKNYTKYARDLDQTLNFYNGKKNGYAWCDVFADWCFVEAFGVEEAKKLLCQPEKSLGAGCGYSMNYYKNKGQFHTKPAIGDQIFFYNKTKTGIAHTGIVYDVDDTYVYTVEGNTSPSSGVVDNGGMVCKKSYALNYDRIAGYGRPNYDPEPVVEPTSAPTPKPAAPRNYLMKGDKGAEVKAMQEDLIFAGYSCGKDGADGSFGGNTEKALKAFQDDYKLEVDGKYGPKSKAKLEELVAKKKAKKTTVTYITHRIPSNKWGNEIKGYNLTNDMGYSGVFGQEIDKVAIKLSEGKITYTAHRNGRWGGEIQGYSKSDTNKYAGSTNRAIDAIAIKAEGINGTLKYRVHRKTDNKWGNWITGYSKTDTNKYAGSFGKAIDAIQIAIE